MKKLAIAITAVSIAFGITGCSPLPGNSDNIAALAGLKAHPMPGFELAGSDNGDAYCLPASYCSPNTSVMFTSTKKFASRAEFCRDLIPWAKEIGADSFQFDPDYIALPFEGREGAAQFACNGTNNFSLVGSTGEVRWMVTGGMDQLSIETVMGREEGGMDDPRMALKTWEQAVSQLFPESKLNIDILSAVETYRQEHPEADPGSLKTVQTALKGIQFPDGAKIVKDKAGKAHYVYLPGSAAMTERCLNITTFDREYFMMDDPGQTFVALANLEGGASLDVFGATNYTACPKP